jgi:tetratricopeptide (TPR) repeat protein
MITENKRKALEAFAEGRKQYKLMHFEEALKHFSEALQFEPNDGPSQEYFQRCKTYIEQPPPEDWDGVFVMKTK